MNQIKSIFQKGLLNLALKSGSIPQDKGVFYDHKWFGRSLGYKYGGAQKDETLINEGYASNTDVYAIVRKITEAAINIPIDVYEKTNDGLVLVEDSGLVDLLNEPNKYQTQSEFRESALANILLTGDMFLLGLSAIGFDNTVEELSVLASGITEVLTDSKNNVIGYRYTANGTTIDYTLDDVYHGKYYNPTTDGLECHRGLSPLQAGYRTLIASNELITAEASVYKNKGISGILSSGGETLMTPKEAKDIQSKLNDDIGGAEKANGVKATSANVKFTQIGMSPSDMEILKSGDVKLRGLCRLYGLDSNLIGDPKGSTFNNVQSAMKQFYTNAVIPNNERYISYLQRFVVPAYSKAENREYVLKQDTSRIEALQVDKKSEAEKNSITAGTITGVLSAPISDEAKIATLVISSGITQGEAEQLVPVTNEDEDGTGANQNTGGNVQVQSLNGAQVTSMVSIVASVTNGDMPKESAITILVVSFGLSPEQAAQIINPIVVQPKPTENG